MSRGSGEATEAVISWLAYDSPGTDFVLIWRFFFHTRTINQLSQSHGDVSEAGIGFHVFGWRYTFSLAISPFTCQWTASLSYLLRLSKFQEVRSELFPAFVNPMSRTLDVLNVRVLAPKGSDSWQYR